MKQYFFFPPLTQSSCFQTLNSTAGYNLCTVKMQTHTFLYTLESSWVLLYGYTCRGIWLLEQNRCFYAVKHLYYTLLVVLSPPFAQKAHLVNSLSSNSLAQGSWLFFCELCRSLQIMEKRGVSCSTQKPEFPVQNIFVKEGGKNLPTSDKILTWICLVAQSVYK